MKLFVVVDQEGSARRNNRIVEKRAVVTGASSGIGVATARALAKDGFKVFFAARRAYRVAKLAKEIGGVTVACDVSEQRKVDQLTTRPVAQAA